MSKYLKSAGAALALLALTGTSYSADAEAGAKVFRKCGACHAVGEGAKNKVGPQLNDLFGRVAGSIEEFKYSKAMVESGVTWDEESLAQYLTAPRKFIKGTRMAFAGLKKEDDLANVIAYLKTFDPDISSAAEPAAKAKTEEASAAPSATETTQETASFGKPSSGKFGLGRTATSTEVAAWDIDIRPDGMGLPEGRGTVAEGEPIYAEQCAACHGDFGEAIGRWPVLAGGFDTLTDDRPVKTVGSYWPYLSTVYDYIRRAMPFGNARSLSDDEVYALTAYVLYLNDIVTDEDFELSSENFAEVELPNTDAFVPDDRLQEPHYAEKNEPCMRECKPEPVEITMRARVLDVTPDADNENENATTID